MASRVRVERENDVREALPLHSNDILAYAELLCWTV
jgi:hypothetical protein